MTHKNFSPGSVDYTVVETTHVVMPQSTNVLGTVFGGEVMSWIDICAAVSAQRHCRSNVVTASFDDVHFIYPIKHGHVVILRSQVNAVFSSSMEIGTEVYAEHPLDGSRTLAIRARSTFVSVDEKGRPKICPPLQTKTAEEKEREKAALERRKLRLEARKKESDRFKRRD